MAKSNGNGRFNITIGAVENPVALYFSRQGNAGKDAFQELSGRVAKLLIEPVEGDAEGGHWLRRFDREGQPVWSTRHPSLQETFWYAEWEYGVKQQEWHSAK